MAIFVGAGRRGAISGMRDNLATAPSRPTRRVNRARQAGEEALVISQVDPSPVPPLQNLELRDIGDSAVSP